jgi:uncharacterized protein YbjT (DUF2867 family)
MRILITGSTGNVGREVIKHLLLSSEGAQIIAGVRDLEGDKKVFANQTISFCRFDFEDQATFEAAFTNCDVLFLLRPPHISNVAKYFKPLIIAAKAFEVKHIVFLSVQGVEKSSIIPHHKIEKLIAESGISYTFIRPAYFMQNFTTTLRKDILEKKQIFLPAGRAKFTVIDASDIGAVCATVLSHPAQHINQAYELTNNEKLTFEEMANKISFAIGSEVKFISPNLIRFFIQKRKEGFILVMIMLHYLPRFQAEPPVTNWVKQLTGKEPKTFDEFASENRSLFV